MSLHAFGMFLGVKLIPLIYAIVGFGALIAIHECGHFIFCKLFGIHTPTFSIGFGPELFRKKIGKTDFRLAAIPLGGYVEIAGLAEVGQGDQEHAHASGPDSFESKPYWQKFLVIAGGIIFNIIFAYVVFCMLFMIGSKDPQGIMVAGILKESAAEKYGIKPEDAIIAINQEQLRDENGMLLPNARETILLENIRSNPDKEVNFTVLRKDQTLTIPVTLGSREENGTTIGVLGAELYTPIFRLSFFQALKAGFDKLIEITGVICYSIKYLFTQRSLKGAGGPVMIMSMSFNAAQQGILALLTFLALISINLALINVIPLGALDGGQILFITIEAIIGRKMPLGLRNGINLVSWVLLLSLAVYLTYQDIAYLFGKKIMWLWGKVSALWH